jgi:hypothetical protein
MTRHFLGVFLASLLAASLALPPDALAQDKAKTTFTDPREADADFAYQGEFAGGGWGLQVVAGGDGKFTGMLYYGGLPGNGWNRNFRQPLQGELSDGSLQLSGETYRVAANPYVADLFDPQGRWIARLRNVVRTSRSLGMRAPYGADVLFDGTHPGNASAEKFVNGRVTEDGLLKMGTMTKEPVGDFQLHIEFLLPYMPHARGQARANSGVYIQQRYEVQILDSFGLEGGDNECASLYKQRAPELNMAFPPLAWQTYDIWFRQPRWSDDGEKLEPARITVLHNGVAVHWNQELTNKTGGGKPEGPEEFPIALQDHGNPVLFRNIWIVRGEPGGQGTGFRSQGTGARSQRSAFRRRG